MAPVQVEACPLTPLNISSGLQFEYMSYNSNDPRQGPEGCVDGLVYACDSLGFVAGDKVRAKAFVQTNFECCHGEGRITLSAEGPIAEFSDQKLALFPYAMGSQKQHPQVHPSQLEAVTSAHSGFYEYSKSWWTCGAQCANLDKFVSLDRRWTMLARRRMSNGHPSMRVFADLSPLPGRRPQCCLGEEYSAEYKYVLFLTTDPHHDHNLAFGMSKLLCERFLCWGRRGFDVVVRHVDSVAHARKEIRKFPRRSIHHVSLGGHGDSLGLQLGKDKLFVGDKDSRALFRELRDKTKLNASVLLDSCSTGKSFLGLTSLFRGASTALSGRRVLVATQALDDGMWVPEKEGQCLTGDRVVFRKGDKDVYVIAPQGQPRCKEFDEEDIRGNIGQVCLASCSQTCLQAQEFWRSTFPWSQFVQRVLLTEDTEIVEDRVNNCPLQLTKPFRTKRKVCRLSVQ
uniref:CHAT domain-containing protein n=1 Tax=Zooxanthella nutricula TaxID=1333877 RepID=A0A7S2M2S4_9DINO